MRSNLSVSAAATFTTCLVSWLRNVTFAKEK
jgi:hypothetical protein